MFSNAAYGALLFNVETLPFRPPATSSLCSTVLKTCAAAAIWRPLLVEPLVLGAGGMKMYPAHILAAMREITERHGVLLAVDEVMTGWGRTGTLFACEQAGITPDILCTSKGLTGGSLPLAATLCTAAIFDAHYSDDRSKNIFPFKLLHRQPDCLRGGARQSASLAQRTGDRTDIGPHPDADGTASPLQAMTAALPVFARPER